MTRKNLLYNPSFRQGLDGWKGIRASIAVTKANYYFGTESVVVTKTNVNNAGIESTNRPPVVPGLPYACLAYVMIPVTDPATEPATMRFRVIWLDFLGNQMVNADSTTAETVVNQASGWTTISGVVTAPPGAAYAQVRVEQSIFGSNGQKFIVDAVMFEQAAYVSGYVDNFTYDEQVYIVNKSLAAVPPQLYNSIPLNADVVLNDLILNTIDEYGVVWVCTDIDGWWVHSTPSMQNIERGVEDGSYDVSGRYQARTLTLSGSFLPPDASAMPAARDRLIAATNLVRKGAWLRTSENPTRAAYVRLSGRPKITTVNARGRTDFEIQLTAANPVKYHWYDNDPDGISRQLITANDVRGVVTNIGTSDVRAVFRLTGPMGSGSTIYNATTNETMTLVNPLRRAAAVATVTRSELYDGVATLTTDGDHQLVTGDTIRVLNVGPPFDSGNTPWVVTSQSSDPTAPYTVSYKIPGVIDIPATSVSGSVSLSRDDLLEIDTYEKSVTFNDSDSGQRYRVKTLVDWVRLAPGDNLIVVNDNINDIFVYRKELVNGVATMYSTKPHYLQPPEEIRVKLPEVVDLAAKELTGNRVTLTTEEGHGFSIGDNITVNSTTVSSIEAKQITYTPAAGAVAEYSTATLTTVDRGAFAVSDKIDVNLPLDASVSAKAADASLVTMTTAAAHGFTTGDEVTVTLATAGTIGYKALTVANQVTLGTKVNHNFSVGDSVTVAMPTDNTVTFKRIEGNTATLTTSTNHNYSNSDVVSVAFPTSVVPTGTAVYSGASNYLVTLTVPSGHNYIAGDQITVNIDNPTDPLIAVYNGARVVETVTSTTISYLSYGQIGSATAAIGPGATIVNRTNTALSGNKTITCNDGVNNTLMPKNQFSFTVTGI